MKPIVKGLLISAAIGSVGGLILALSIVWWWSLRFAV